MQTELGKAISVLKEAIGLEYYRIIQMEHDGLITKVEALDKFVELRLTLSSLGAV